MVQTLSEMRADECGTILEIHGGQGLLNRLGALGIIPGKKITKISSLFMRGPVTVLVNRTQIALGFGMSGKIIVNVGQRVK